MRRFSLPKRNEGAVKKHCTANMNLHTYIYISMPMSVYPISETHRTLINIYIDANPHPHTTHTFGFGRDVYEIFTEISPTSGAHEEFYVFRQT